MIFVTADLHIGHRAIALHANRKQFIYPNPDYDPDKPKDFKNNWPLAVKLEEHDQFLIDNYNRMVGKKDTTIIIGDFIWKNEMHNLQRFNGKKILIVGNHDRENRLYLRQFSEVHLFLTRTFEKKYFCTFFHYPMISWPGSCRGSWQFHGHCHGRITEFIDSLRCDCGVDVWDYKPIPWEVLKKKMESRMPYWRDRVKNRELEEQKTDTVAELREENRMHRSSKVNKKDSS